MTNQPLPIAMAMIAFLIAGCGSESSTWTTASPKMSGSESKSDSVSTEKTQEKTPIAKRDSPTVVHPKVDTSDPNRPSWDPKGIADFALTERSGRKVKRADLLGKPWVVCFIFTHCAGPCSDISGQMYQLQEWLKTNKIDDVKLLTVTVDPKRDTPDVLQRYSKNFGADKDRWWFVTGDQDELYKLIESSFGQRVFEYIGKERKKGWEIFHTSAVMLVDERGKVVEEFNGKYPTSMLSLQSRLRDWKKTGTFAKPEPAKTKPTAKTSKPHRKASHE